MADEAPQTKEATIGGESVEVETVDAAKKPKVPDVINDPATNPAKTKDNEVNASAPVGQVNPVPDVSTTEDGDEVEGTPSAAAVKEAADIYTRVYRVQAVEQHSKKLPEGFPDEAYAVATVREAIQHGWRVSDGVVAKRGKVTFADPGEYNIDIPYSVEVFAAAGAPLATLPPGKSLDETTEEQPNTGDEGSHETN